MPRSAYKRSMRFGNVSSNFAPHPTVNESPSITMRSLPGGFSYKNSRSRKPFELGVEPELPSAQRDGSVDGYGRLVDPGKYPSPRGRTSTSRSRIASHHRRK